MNKIEVGSRITYTGDMANASGSGLVVAIRKHEGAGKMFSMAGGKLEPMDSSQSFDVVLGDGRRFNGVYAANISGDFSNKSCRFMLDGGVGSTVEVAAMIAGNALYEAELKAKGEEVKAAFEKAQAEALAAGKALGLIPEADFKAAGKRGSAAAWNLRQELKAACIKAKVKQDGYAAIDVWVADDNREAAKKIAAKYEAGRFDGMTDCYDYDPSAWGSVFGDVRYVFVYVDEKEAA